MAEIPPRRARGKPAARRATSPRKTSERRPEDIELDRLLDRYEELQRQLKAEKKTGLASHEDTITERDKTVEFFALVRKQLVEWEQDPTEETFGLDELMSNDVTISVDFDLDRNDNLIIVRIVVIDGTPEGAEDLGWGPPGTGSNTETYLDSIVITTPDKNLATFASDVLAFKDPTIPDFPKLIANNRDPLTKALHRSYAINDEKMATFYETLYADYPLYTTLKLLEVWLSLHDLDYLEQIYGLRAAKPVTKLPRLLTTEDDVLTAIISAKTDDPSTSVYAYIPDEATLRRETPEPYRGEYRYLLERLSVKGKWGSNYTNTAVEITKHIPERDLTPRDILYRYQQHRDKGYVFFQDLDHYTERSEAVQALFRLRHLTSTPYEAAKAAPTVAAARGVYATIVPHEGGFAPIVPISYTGTEAEKRWREICKTREETPENIEALKEYASLLGISTKASTVKGLCTVIEKQHEAEFGERARLREAAAPYEYSEAAKATIAKEEARLAAKKPTEMAAMPSSSSSRKKSPPKQRSPSPKRSPSPVRSSPERSPPKKTQRKPSPKKRR